MGFDHSWPPGQRNSDPKLISAAHPDPSCKTPCAVLRCAKWRIRTRRGIAPLRIGDFARRTTNSVRFDRNRTAAFGRVRMWRGGLRFSLSVTAPFVWRCLSSRTNHSVSTSSSSNRTCGFPASGSRTRRHAFTHGSPAPKSGQADEPEVPVEVREGIRPAPASPDLVLVAQPPAQPRSGVVVERTVGPVGRPYPRVVRPAAQGAVQLLHQLRGPGASSTQLSAPA